MLKSLMGHVLFSDIFSSGCVPCGLTNITFACLPISQTGLFKCNVLQMRNFTANV